MSSIIICIAGPSGAGKTYITKELQKKYPTMFNQVKQVTTREKRNEDDDTYDFISKEEYEKIKDTLVACTEVNGNFYGTRLDSMDTKPFQIIVINKKGIEDLIEARNSSKGEILLKHSMTILGIDSEVCEPRKGRSLEQVEQERKELKTLIDENYWLTNTKDKFISTEDFINKLYELGDFNILPPYTSYSYNEDTGLEIKSVEDIVKPTRVSFGIKFGKNPYKRRLFEIDKNGYEAYAIPDVKTDDVRILYTPEALVNNKELRSYVISDNKFREEFLNEQPLYKLIEDELRNTVESFLNNK